MKTKILFLVRSPLVRLCIIVGVAAGGYLLYAQYLPNKIVYTLDDATYNKAYWESEIKRLGPVKTYQEFKEKNEQAPVNRQHFASHVMGGLLAESLGVSGITACDASYSFGCYHGFFARVISDGGAIIISSLDKVCVDTYGPFGTGCQHGIGHGIMEYTGYEKITEALELCRNTTQKVPLLGCTSGVFMEYNTPLGGSANALSPQRRSLDPKDPYAPCTSVKEEFRASCYFELGHWAASGGEVDSRESKEFCSALSGTNRSNCVLGIGDATAPVHAYSLQESLAVCASLAPDDRISCSAGVSWGFWSNPTHRDKSDAVCASLPTEGQKICNRMADLTEGLTNH